MQLGGITYRKILDFLGFFSSTIFDPYVRLAGASGPAYAMLSAHLANVILHHASMSRPFLRLTGLLAVASLEVGFGIYRRYVSIYILIMCFNDSILFSSYLSFLKIDLLRRIQIHLR